MFRPASTAALFCIASLTAANAQSLSGKALSDVVSGSLVEIDTPLGTKLPIHYSDNGRISGDAKDLASYLGAAADTGRWWVEDDRLCHKWNKWFKTETQCLRIERRGSLVNWRAQDGTSGTATIVSRMETAASAPAQSTRADAARPVAGVTTSSMVMASAAPARAKLEPPMRLIPPAALDETSASPEKAAIEKASPGQAPATPAASVKRPAVVASASGAGLVSRSAAGSNVMPAAKPTKPAPPQSSAPAVDATVSEAKDTSAVRLPEAGRRATGPLFKVANVDSDDVLNIRYGPSAETVAVGTIPHDGRDIELLGECQSGWCSVRHRNVSGWVRRSFLANEQEARPPLQPAAFTRGYADAARRDSPDAPRSCLTPAARGLLDQVESKFGPMRLVSTCRPGATIAGSGRTSRHASGNAIDFEAGGRKREVVAWLIANHQAGGTMTYSDMEHVHIDIGPHFVSLGAPSHGGGGYARRSSRWADSG